MLYNETFTFTSKDACNFKDSENYKSSAENSSESHSYKYGALLSDPLPAASSSTKTLAAGIPQATQTILGGDGCAAIASATRASHGIKSNERRGLFSSSECSDSNAACVDDSVAINDANQLEIPKATSYLEFERNYISCKPQFNNMNIRGRGLTYKFSLEHSSPLALCH